MKIAVYGIAKNEEANVRGWFKNIKNADYVLILDTGSSDKTVDIAKSLGINVFCANVLPWDEAIARNIALSMLPEDIDVCISVDLDEHISSTSWRSEIEQLFEEGIYFSKSITTDGTFDVIKPIKNIHPRVGYYWYGYRPKIYSYPGYPGIVTETPVDVSTTFITGTAERYSHRDPLYAETFLRNFRVLEERKQSIDSEIIEAITYLALSYFEVEDFDKFLKMRESLLIYLQQAPGHVVKNTMNNMLIDFAYSLIVPESTMEVFGSWSSYDTLSEIVKRRKLLFLFLTKQEDLLRKYRKAYDIYKEIDYQQEKIIQTEEQASVLLVIDKFLSGKVISKEDVFSVVNSYSSIGWGKQQFALSKKIAERHWQL